MSCDVCDHALLRMRPGQQHRCLFCGHEREALAVERDELRELLRAFETPADALDWDDDMPREAVSEVRVKMAAAREELECYLWRHRWAILFAVDGLTPPTTERR